MVRIQGADGHLAYYIYILIKPNVSFLCLCCSSQESNFQCITFQFCSGVLLSGNDVNEEFTQMTL